MRHTTSSEKHGTHHTLVAEFWVVVGIMALIILGDALAVSAVAVPVVIAAWWIYREVAHRFERQHVAMAPVTHLRPAFTGQHDPKSAAVHGSWDGPRAA